jgi:hypothetical protein
LKAFEARVARGADDPATRYYIATVHALQGNTDLALDSLARVERLQPELTRARASRDPDLDPLRADPRFMKMLGPRPAAAPAPS